MKKSYITLSALSLLCISLTACGNTDPEPAPTVTETVTVTATPSESSSPSASASDSPSASESANTTDRSSNPYTGFWRVTEVIDGDTVEVQKITSENKLDGKAQKIHLLGVTSDKYTYQGGQARQSLEKLLPVTESSFDPSDGQSINLVSAEDALVPQGDDKGQAPDMNKDGELQRYIYRVTDSEIEAKGGVMEESPGHSINQVAGSINALQLQSGKVMIDAGSYPGAKTLKASHQEEEK